MLVAALAACGSPTQTPEWTTGDCQQLELTDRFARQPLRGAEDIAVDRRSGTIYVSAYDRFALEDALAAHTPPERSVGSAFVVPSAPPDLPRGGIYALAPETVRTALSASGTQRASARVAEVTGAFVGPADFRPHGLDIYDNPLGNPLLAAVVHQYGHSPRGLEPTSGIVLYEIEPEGLRERARIFHEGLCRANDVAIVGPQTMLVTRDHGACRGWAAVEDVLSLKRSSVVRLTLTEEGTLARPPVPVAGGIGYANGIVVDRRERRVIVAATREKALLVFDLDRMIGGHAGRPLGRLALDGGPDNLILEPGGRLLAAVHPSLLRLGFYRRRWLGTEQAPAQVVEVDLGDAEARTLYRDTDGSRFPAITVAARSGGYALMGSVGAHGLLVCGTGPEETTEPEDMTGPMEGT